MTTRIKCVQIHSVTDDKTQKTHKCSQPAETVRHLKDSKPRPVWRDPDRRPADLERFSRRSRASSTSEIVRWVCSFILLHDDKAVTAVCSHFSVPIGKAGNAAIMQRKKVGDVACKPAGIVCTWWSDYWKDAAAGGNSYPQLASLAPEKVDSPIQQAQTFTTHMLKRLASIQRPKSPAVNSRPVERLARDMPSKQIWNYFHREKTGLFIVDMYTLLQLLFYFLAIHGQVLPINFTLTLTKMAWCNSSLCNSIKLQSILKKILWYRQRVGCTL